jgi:hypothetical protein
VNQKNGFEKNSPIMWVGATSARMRYDAEAMAHIDWEKERQRLAALYAGMEQGELEEIAAQSESLTEIARQVLHSEISRRGMKALPETSEPRLVDPKQSDPPVMIRRFRDLPEAQIAKSILDSAGIESFLGEENIVRLDWFYSNLVSGLKLLVRAEDAEAASKLLEQDVPESFDFEGLGEYKQPRCPRCQSLDVAFDGLDKHVTYALLLLLPIPITNKGWKCHSCGNVWKDDSGMQTRPPAPEEPHSKMD